MDESKVNPPQVWITGTNNHKKREEIREAELLSSF